MYILAIIIATSTLLLIHPYITYPASIALISWLSPKRPSIATSTTTMQLSLICCVHNEIKILREKVANLLSIQERLGNCEIIVYDDASTDGSTEYLRTHQDKIKLIEAKSRAGKTAGINKLNEQSTGEIIVLSDANVIVDNSSISSLFSYFSDPSVGCVSGTLFYTNEEESETAYVGAAYRKFEEWLKRIESETGTIVYTDGTLFAVRRELFPFVPADLTDDFFIALNVIKKGFRIVSAPQFLAYERASTKSSDEFHRRVRIGCNSFSCHLQMWPSIRSFNHLTLYKYMSHKLIRWLSSYILVVNILSIFALALLAFGVKVTLFCLLIIGLSTWVMWILKIAIVKRAVDIAGAILATGYGVYLAIRGHRFHIWKISESSRKR